MLLLGCPLAGAQWSDPGVGMGDLVHLQDDQRYLPPNLALDGEIGGRQLRAGDVEAEDKRLTGTGRACSLGHQDHRAEGMCRALVWAGVSGLRARPEGGDHRQRRVVGVCPLRRPGQRLT